MCLWPRVILASNVLVVAAGWAVAADGAPSHQIPRTESALEVDGILDEPAWATAWTTELPYEVSPADNTPAPVRTVGQRPGTPGAGLKRQPSRATRTRG